MKKNWQISTKQHLLAILATALLPTVTMATNQAACQVQRLKAATAEPRIHALQLKNGAEIVLVGHDHGPRDFDRRLQELLFTDTLSNAEFEEKINTTLNQFARAAKQSQEDLNFLKTYLNNNNEQVFLGYESTQEVAHANAQWLAKVQKSVNAELSRRNMNSSTAMNNLILLAAGTPLYFNLHLSTAADNNPVFGFESKEAIQEWRIANKEKDDAIFALSALIPQDPEFFKNLKSTEISLEESYKNFNYNRDAAAILDMANKNSPEKYREPIMRWINGILNELKLRKGRDVVSAQNIVNRGQSGVVFIGASHIGPLAELITEACIKQEL